MTMLFCDGFDHYLGSQILRKWSILGGSMATTTGTKRNGAQSITFNTSNTVLGYTPGGSHFTDQQCIIGFALRFDSSFPVASGPHPIVVFADGGGTHASLLLSASRQLQVARGTSTVIETGSATLQVDTWYYIEVKMKITNSTSADDVIVHLDEVEDINLTPGSDTQAGPSPGLTTLGIGRAIVSSGGNLWFDDLYMLDWEGSDNNDFLGDVIVETLWPDGNGNSSDFLGSDADKVNNYLHVDDATPDDDSTYVESSTLTEKDLYTFDDLSNTPNTVYAVVGNIHARKTEQTARTVKQQTRVNSTDYEGDEQALATGYANYQHIWENNPDDAAAWEEADVNGAEFGIKVHA